MSWLQKMFGKKKCCENCCHEEHKNQPVAPVTPTPEVKVEPTQPEHTDINQ